MESRTRLGAVLHISKSSGNLILGSGGGGNIGDAVLDGRGRKIGIIFDVFGPVAEPFVSVNPSVESPERLLGKALYVRKRRRKGR